MRNLRSNKRPDFDDLWPELEGTIWEISSFLARKHKRDKHEIVSTVVLIANHLLFSYRKTGKANFKTYLIVCAKKMIRDSWLQCESEFDRQVTAFDNKRVSQQKVENFEGYYLELEPDELTERIEKLGKRFWDRITKGMNPYRKSLIIKRFKQGKSLKEIGKELNRSPVTICRTISNAMKELRTKLKMTV